MTSRYLRSLCVLLMTALALAACQAEGGILVPLPPVLTTAAPSSYQTTAVSATPAITETAINWFQIQEGLSRVEFSPDGQIVAIYPTESLTPTVSLADVATGEVMYELEDAYGVAAFSPDGRKILTTDGRLWDVASGEVIHVLGAGRGTFSPDGQIIVITDGEPVRAWDTASGEEMFVVDGALKAIVPNRALVVTFSINGDSVKFRDAASGQVIRELPGDWAGMSPDKRSFISIDEKFRSITPGTTPTFTVYDCSTGSPITTIAGFWPMYSPTGERIAVSSGGATDIWDTRTGQKVFSLEGSLVVPSPFGPLSGDQFGVLSRFADWPSLVSRVFSADGRLIITSVDSELYLWDLATGEKISSFQGRESDFSPDGQRLAIFGTVLGPPPSGKTDVWNLQTGLKEASFDGRVRFTPDGQDVFAFRDLEIVLWDAASGERLESIPLVEVPHEDQQCDISFDVAFSQNGSEAYITADYGLCWNSGGGTSALKAFRPVRATKVGRTHRIQAK